MEFFVENWLWFLVAAIIILMTLIGYIAEKTDFGRKDIPKREKVKKEKKAPKAKEELAEVLEPEAKPEVQMSLATDSIFEEPVQTLEELDNTNVEPEIMENLNVPFDNINIESPKAEEEISETMENLNDSYTDFTYQEPTINIEEPIETFENVETLENLTIPFGNTTYDMPVSEVEEVVENEPIVELEDSNISNIELPDLDSIVTEEDDTEDVWKF